MIDPDDALAKVATGLSLLRRPSTGFSDILELGIRDLQASSLIYDNKSLPASRFDLLSRMETPIQEWWPGPLPNCESDGVLLRFGEATTFCMEWAYSLRDVNAQMNEIDEHIMKKIIDICRSDRSGYYALYVNSRKFIIERPVVRLKEIIDQVSKGNILSEVQNAYEPIPAECIENGSVFLCHHCHDAMIIKDDHLYCRNWIICERHGNFSKKQVIKFATDLRRLRRGMKAYICIPGLPEIELNSKLMKLKLETSLWPGIDEYDLRLRLPSGKVWAVDVKATKSPWLLGKNEAEKGFIQQFNLPSLHWDRAFYVIANEFFSPQYKKLFWDGARSAGSTNCKISLLSARQFLHTVKREI
jgi:hypothetical protein